MQARGGDACEVDVCGVNLEVYCTKLNVSRVKSDSALGKKGTGGAAAATAVLRGATSVSVASHR